MGNYIDQLNDQQREAVLYTGGPELVIAGAGSGKTRVLTYKILHLLESGYEPWRIMALTFTNKAAREMRERIEALVGHDKARRLWMGTFHSIFSRILRIHADKLGFKPSFTIYDASDSKAVVKAIIKDMDLDEKVYKPSSVASAISMAKNALISPAQYALDRDLMESDKRSRKPRIQEIYAGYVNRLSVAGAMDFDDLLYYTNVLLRDNPDILNHYREYFRYILVDEYQDTNFAQHLIVSQLCDNGAGLCVVGDDAQSIYSFRGANIRNILNLKKAYPDLSVFKLEQNYRSTQNIINAANSLIDKNQEQIRKKVFSLNDPGERIELVQSYSDYEESFLVANRISQVKMATGAGYDEFAVLYRTNAQSRILEESLRKRNIPYRIYGGLSFYQRKEVKDAVAYMRLTVNPDDDEALRRIINFPARGIGETTVGKLTRSGMEHGVSLWHVINHLDRYSIGFNSGTVRKLDGFRVMIQGFMDKNSNGADAATVVRYIITETGMLSMLMHDRTPESISKQENLNELIGGVKAFVDERREEGSGEMSLGDFLGEISLSTDQDSKDEADDGKRVTLMTVHAAKGLEFSNVFIVGVEEDLFPSAMNSASAAEVEEERRLLYVAITRAKRFCMLSYASSRFRNGMTVTCSPSRFVRDIDPRYLRLAGGTSISYGAANPVERYRSSFHSAPKVESRAEARRITVSPANAAKGCQARPKTSGRLHVSDEVAPGMRIHHSIFGDGTVKEVDTSMADHRIVVDFDNTGSKRLMLKFAKFDIIDKKQ